MYTFVLQPLVFHPRLLVPRPHCTQTERIASPRHTWAWDSRREVPLL